MVTDWILRFKRIIVLMLLNIAAIMSGCGKEEVSRNSEELLSEYVYVPEFYSPNENIDTMSVFGNTIYYGTSEGVFYAWDVGEGKEPEKMNISVAESERYNWGAIQPDLQGNFYLIYNIDRYGEGEKIPVEELEDNAYFDDTYLVKYDAEGKELFCERLIGDLQSCYIYSTAVDTEGHLFILGDGKVVLYDIDCSYKGVLTNPYRMNSLKLTNDGNGRVFIDCLGIIRQVSFSEGVLEEAYEDFVVGNGFTSFQESGFLITMSGKVYLYDNATQTNEEIFKWMNCNVDSAQVEKFAALKDGRIVAFLEDEDNGITGEIVLLTKTLRENVPQKDIITIGTFSASENLMRTVVRFNKHSEQYKAEVIEYYDPSLDSSLDGSQKKEAYTRLHLDIISDRCPDILNLEYEDLQEYVYDGLFENLEPYLKKSGLDIMPNVIEAYTFDGQLLALPATLKIRTIVGRTAQLDGKTEWTLQEWMDFIENHPDQNIIKTDAKKMLEYCLLMNHSVFIDMKKNTCDFTSDSFCELLEFCNSFSGEENYYSTSIFKVPRGNELLYELELNQANDITLLNQLFQTDDITFIGFPSVDGSAGNILEEKGGSYAISSLSEYKDGAWSFLETLMADTVKVSVTVKNTGIPAEEDTRREYFNSIMEDPYDEYGDRNYTEVLIDSINNYKLYYYVPIQEEADILFELLETAQIPKDYDKKIMNMILEEAESYFTGLKTVEDVARIIQSRVVVYLEEQR